jgi:hypothetical protein
MERNVQEDAGDRSAKGERDSCIFWFGNGDCHPIIERKRVSIAMSFVSGVDPFLFRANRARRYCGISLYFKKNVAEEWSAQWSSLARASH